MKKKVKKELKGVWIPLSISQNDDLTGYEKILLGLVCGLDNESGCWAQNRFLANVLNINIPNVSRCISSLEKKGFIVIERVVDGIHEKRVIQVLFDYDSGSFIDSEAANNVLPVVDQSVQETTLVAYDFLKKDDPGAIEVFEMQNKNKTIKKWDVFLTNYNCKVDEEGIEWTKKKLMARLKRMAGNWKDMTPRANNTNQVDNVLLPQMRRL